MKKLSNTQYLVYTALLIAISYLGGMIKLFGSVALDALPAYYAALVFGGPMGAIVGAAGHILSAILSGFPLSLPMHLAIMICMAAACWFFGFLNEKTNIYIASAVAIFINAVVLNFFTGYLAVLMGLVPNIMTFVTPIMIPLLIASAVNVLAAVALYFATKMIFKD